MCGVCLYIFSHFSVTLCGNLERWDSLRKAKQQNYCQLASFKLCPSSISLSPLIRLSFQAWFSSWPTSRASLFYIWLQISPHILLMKAAAEFSGSANLRYSSASRSAGVLVLKLNAISLVFKRNLVWKCYCSSLRFYFLDGNIIRYLNRRSLDTFTQSKRR